MFKSAPAAVPAVEAPDSTSGKLPQVDLIPLSVLALDHPIPAEGWPVFLGRHGIAFTSDDLGRDSIRRGDAKRLMDEYRADQLRKQAVLKVQEQAAIEADQLRRAQIYRGVPVVEGLSGTEALLAAAAADNPHRRISPVEEALGGNRDLVTIRPHSSAPDEWFTEGEAS
jgi:hypothetical protein